MLAIQCTDKRVGAYCHVQVQKETLPWLLDLVQPLREWDPKPLDDTLPPTELADPDSKFVEVDGVLLHYKECGSCAPGAPAVLLLHGLNGSVFSWSAPHPPCSSLLACLHFCEC